MSTPGHEAEVQELRRRLEEAEETLRAIRSGEVDALLVEGVDGERVYTLQGADHPYRTLIEAMEQGALSLSDDGTVLYCNNCFAEMLQVPHEKVIGGEVSKFLPVSQRAAFSAMLQQGRNRTSQGELEFLAADGSRLPVLVAVAPLPISNAAALCMVVTDLTEHKEHLDLQEASKRKDEFLAMLAHELRNPLAPIQNAVAILQSVGLTDETPTYAVEIIERQVKHLSRLVDDLLDVSRLTLGKINLHKQVVDLTSVIDRAVETSRPVIDARKHKLTIACSAEDVLVEADPTRLAQVIGNLLTNAAKYTDEGGEVLLQTERDGDEVVIHVRDTGIGIPAESLQTVFDLFTQGDVSLVRSDGGLGIGLTLVRRLVELHGGTVEAHSDGAGKGSEFVVRLPARTPDRSDSAGNNPAQSPKSERAAGQRILVVEDNKDGANTLAMFLKLTGHEVHIAYSARDALEAAGKHPPDVILLDIGLPEMSGYEVAEQLRERPELDATVLVAMTGYGQEEDKQRSRDAGFYRHLVKPVDPEDLKNLLESIHLSGVEPASS